MDFSHIGILAQIAKILAGQNISIFAVSTYDTDYIFVKEENFEKAVRTLEGNHYRIIETGEISSIENQSEES